MNAMTSHDYRVQSSALGTLFQNHSLHTNNIAYKTTYIGRLGYMTRQHIRLCNNMSNPCLTLNVGGYQPLLACDLALLHWTRTTTFQKSLVCQTECMHHAPQTLSPKPGASIWKQGYSCEWDFMRSWPLQATNLLDMVLIYLAGVQAFCSKNPVKWSQQFMHALTIRDITIQLAVNK